MTPCEVGGPVAKFELLALLHERRAGRKAGPSVGPTKPLRTFHNRVRHLGAQLRAGPAAWARLCVRVPPCV